MEVKGLPKHVKLNNKDGLRYSDKYLTDGTFLIPKYLVKESYKYYNPANSQKKIEDHCLEKIINSACEGRFVYKKTNRLFDCGSCYMREFFCAEHFSEENRKLYICDDFVNHYDFEEVKAKDNFSAVSAFNGVLIIMPMRAPKQEKGE